MGDVSIANDIISGVGEAFEDFLGTSRTFQIVTYGAIDPADPGAGGTPSTDDITVQCIYIDYLDYWKENVKMGDRTLIISVNELTTAQINALSIGNRIIDGSVEYEIINANKPEVAGTSVVAILQLRK